MIDTKQKILDTAERLFGQQGFDATSLRQIISEAGVNLAAIHYHFGSKEELLDELVTRKATPVNDERLAMLDRALAMAGEGPLAIEPVLEAFLMPMAVLGPSTGRVMGRLLAEGLMPKLAKRHFGDVIQRFRSALERSLPHLTPEELGSRMHFMMGSLALTMSGQPIFVPGGGEGVDLAERLRCLVTFLSGGFRAPGSR